MDQLTAIIAQNSFRPATSEQYRNTPHEYAILNDADAQIAQKNIAEFGCDEKFFGHTFRYLKFGDQEYWTCGNVLNRTDSKNIYGEQ